MTSTGNQAACSVGQATPVTNPARACFVVFSDDWGVHPSSCQHLFRQIVGHHRVIWVNTIGMRNPTLTWTDLRKAWRKIVTMFGSRPASAAAERPGGLVVCQPFMLPFTGLTAVRRFNKYSVIRAVGKAMQKWSIAKPVVVSTVPNACDYVTELGAQRIVYYCVDDFGSWPGLEHELVRGMERQLVGSSDLIVATARKLQERMLEVARCPVHLMTHGVDVEHFGVEPAQEHPLLQSIPHPRIGYYGLFDARTDVQLLADVASRTPQSSFVIAGPVELDVPRLRAMSNVRFTGPVPYGELPSLIKGLDALMIPYLVNEFTASISPLKLKEYLVSGKPVISTPIAEALRHSDDVFIAATVPEWQAALARAQDADVAGRRRAQRALLATESWSCKAREFVALCLDRDERATRSMPA